MLEIDVVNPPTIPPQMLNRLPHIYGVPHDHGVRDQVQARGLIELIVGMALANLCFVGDEQIPAQGMQGLALVQLPIDLPSELLAAEVTQDEGRFDQSPIFL